MHQPVAFTYQTQQTWMHHLDVRTKLFSLLVLALISMQLPVMSIASLTIIPIIAIISLRIPLIPLLKELKMPMEKKAVLRKFVVDDFYIRSCYLLNALEGGDNIFRYYQTTSPISYNSLVGIFSKYSNPFNFFSL